MLNFAKSAAVAIQVTFGTTLSAASVLPALADVAPANTATHSNTTPQLHEGDLVRLRSGGPVLTVKSVSETWVICSWFDEYGELHSAGFPVAMVAGPLSPDEANP